MKKFIKALICLFLVAAVSLSVVGCGKGSEGGTGGVLKSKSPFAFDEEGNYTGGRHIRQKGTTNYDFIANRRTDYIGVVPSTASRDVADAITEFNTFFKESTGLMLPKVNDTAVTAGQKFISFGRTQQLAAAMQAGQIEIPGLKMQEGQIVIDESAERPLRANGFIIKTVGENIFVVGGEDIAGLEDRSVDLFRTEADVVFSILGAAGEAGLV